MIRVGVDTGGTFTDLVRLEAGQLSVLKVRSTPDDPSRAILAGIAELMGVDAVSEVIHGSTVATNAVLERKGACVALVTNAGFEDVLTIGRQTRRELYNFMVQARRPMVEQGLTFGVSGRLDQFGVELEPLRIEELDSLVENLRQAGAECVAVCLLHSYANPVHEQRVEAHLANAGFAVTTSHRVLPEYREYERWSTTVVNAYVTPMMSRYLTALERGLGETPLHVMQSNGGSISAGEARRCAVRTILSGPAAGAVGGQAIAQASGFNRVILFDMGGTSTDVSLVDGRLGMSNESTVGDFPVRLPMLDIHTVGAGGGSIAYVDAGGALRVGPRSAGADPGPVCYGKGEELTVTDANLLLGRIEAEHFLGGRMPLEKTRTMQRAEAFAAKLQMSVRRLAEGIVQVANANMERAIRAVSVQRGHDPREFALLAFGGAGGMHACEIADTLDISTVLVPQHAGVLSALGMLLADVRKDYIQTILKTSHELSFELLTAYAKPLVSSANADMAAEGFLQHDISIECVLDMRYQGQAYEIPVPLTPDYVEDFNREHQRLYGHSKPGRSTEIVNIRVNAAGITKKHEFPSAEAGAVLLPAPASERDVWFGERLRKTSVYHREQLEPGMEGVGPAIVSGGEATVVIPPNFRFRLDGVGTLVATKVEGLGTMAMRKLV